MQSPAYLDVVGEVDRPGWPASYAPEVISRPCTRCGAAPPPALAPRLVPPRPGRSSSSPVAPTPGRRPDGWPARATCTPRRPPQRADHDDGGDPRGVRPGTALGVLCRFGTGLVDRPRQFGSGGSSATHQLCVT